MKVIRSINLFYQLIAEKIYSWSKSMWALNVAKCVKSNFLYK